jgi:sugar lactone lactonase YvrE
MGNIYTCAVSSSYSVAQWTVSTAGVLGSSTPTTVGIGGSCEGLAVDRQGTVWVSNNQPTATYNLYKLVPPLTTSTTCTSAAGCSGVLNVNSLTGVTSGSYPLGVAVDPNQNIWFADYLSSGVGEVSVLPNSGSLSAPAYAASAISVAAGGEQSYDIAFAPSGTSYVAWVDNNYLSSTASANSGVTEITPSFASSPSTQISGLTKTTYLQTVNDAQGTLVGLNSMAADGAGNIFSDNQNGSQIMETTAAGTNIGLFPCVLKSTGTGCTSSVPTSPRGIAVDSTGSVWVASGTQGMIQIIGLAAPTWPQLSLGKVGKP